MRRTYRRRSCVAACLVALTLTVPAAAQQAESVIDVDALGPQIGERVPGFSLPDQRGVVRTLDSIMGPNGAMLLFHRSADW